MTLLNISATCLLRFYSVKYRNGSLNNKHQLIDSEILEQPLCSDSDINAGRNPAMDKPPIQGGSETCIKRTPLGPSPVSA